MILTLKTDAASLEFFDALRRLHFPPERNFLRAHVTLFHHLPDADLENIRREIAAVCGETSAFPLEFTRWRFLGKGSAMSIESGELLNLRARMERRWKDYLTAQDKQKFQPHITVQNKVAPDEARTLYEKLSADWQPRTGTAEGLTLWHYVQPRWKLEQEFLFHQPSSFM